MWSSKSNIPTRVGCCRIALSVTEQILFGRGLCIEDMVRVPQLPVPTEVLFFVIDLLSHPQTVCMIP